MRKCAYCGKTTDLRPSVIDGQWVCRDEKNCDRLF